MYDITEQGQRQYRRVVGLIWGLYILIPLLFFVTGCSAVPMIELNPQEVEPMYQEPIDKWEECKPWMNIDPEVWSTCMMIA